MQVVAILLVGARPEPYLPSVLKSLEGAIDRLVVNDNSGQISGINRRAIEASQLYLQDLVTIVDAPFEGFARARNHCLEAVRARYGDAPVWILAIDADEVHFSRLALLTRQVLPFVSPRVAAVDGYVIEFMQTFDYFVSLDRRHPLFYRLTPGLRYERDVHEHLQGLRGWQVCAPYVYSHYGYVRPNQQILEKWLLYHGLGDRTYAAENFPKEASEAMFIDQAPLCIPYRGKHPPALAERDARTLAPVEETLAFRTEVQSHLQQPWPRARAWLRRLNYRVRLLYRLLQAPMWVHSPSSWLQLAFMTLGIECGSEWARRRRDPGLQ